MALSLRHLIRRIVTLGFAASAAFTGATVPLRAQPAPPPPPPATFQLYSPSPLGDVFYELKGRSVPVNVSNLAFSDPALAPPGGRVALYRFAAAPEPGLPPVRVPVLTTTVPDKPGASSLLVLYPEGPPPLNTALDIRPLIPLLLDQSPAAFPPGTIRVFSFSARPAIVKIGDTAVPVPAFQLVPIPYPADQRTWLRVATVGDQGWQRVIGSPQSLGANTRLTLFLRDIAPSQYDPKPVGLLLGKILETLPAPAP